MPPPSRPDDAKHDANVPDYSKNERAEKIVGLRPVKPNTIVIDLPCELGYHCPVCKYDTVDDKGNFDERLHWSEYSSFIWCQVCNRDYPSALCQPDIDKAIGVFLDSIEHAPPPVPSSDVEQDGAVAEQRVFNAVDAWMKKYKPSSEESFYQRDSIILALPELGGTVYEAYAAVAALKAKGEGR